MTKISSHTDSDARREPRDTSSAPSPAEPAAPIHLASLLERCLADRAFCRVIMRKFVDRSADLAAALDRAVLARNVADLAQQAHAIKGIAANLSADDLYSRAADLERALLSGKLDQTRPLVVRLRAEIERCRLAAPQILAQLDP